MKTKRYLIILLLIAAVMVVGCQQDDLAEHYAELYYGIQYYDSGVTFRTVGDHLSWDYIEKSDTKDDKEADRYYDLPELQDAVKQYTRGLVLDNDSAILAYAWDLQPILIDFSCIPSDYFPIGVEHYANGIVLIKYADNMSIEIAEDTSGAYWGFHYDADKLVFVAERDGHIILVTSY